MDTAVKALRVEQLDAHVLDREIRDIVHSSLEEWISTLPTALQRYMDRAKPELRLGCEAALWTTRIYAGSSPGQGILDVFYRSYTTRKVAVHFVISVLVPYLLKRLVDWRQDTHRLVERLEGATTLANIAHYLYFLRKGGFSTLVERVLRLRNYNRDAPSMGNVNLDNQNRELLWHTFRDLIVLLWPIYRLAENRWLKWSQKTATSESNDVCPICGEVFVAPVEVELCGHAFCYWCIAAGPSRNSCRICASTPCTLRPARGNRIFPRE